MKVDKYKAREEFAGEDGESLEISYTNRGEPYSEGIDFEFRGWGDFTSFYLEDHEALRLAKLIYDLYGESK